MLTSFVSLTNTKTQQAPVKHRHRRRVGIFGGTFNPIHNGQLIAAEQACTALGLDKLYFMPDAIPFAATHDNAVEPSIRAEMIRLAIRGNSKFDIEMNPIHDGGRQSTFSVMKKLVEEHPEIDYYLIMGSKVFKNFAEWDDANALSRMVRLVAIDQPGIQRSIDFPAIWLQVNWLDISSSDIRSRLRVKQSVRYLIPDMVAAYIAEFNLYQGRI